MRGETAFLAFVDQIAIPARQSALLALEEYFQQHKESLAAAFISDFKSLCRSLSERQATGEIGKIGYITHSILRSEWLTGGFIYLTEVMNKDWFLDRNVWQTFYSTPWVLPFLNGYLNELDRARKSFDARITIAELDAWSLKEITHFHTYVIALLRFAFVHFNSTDWPELQALEKEDIFEIRIGEYLDVSESVYKKNNKPYSENEFRMRLEESEEDAVYCYEDYGYLQLREMELEGLDFRNSSFEGCDFSNSRLNRCILLGTQWRNSILQGVDLTFSAIQGANFSFASMNEACLIGVNGSEGLLDQSEWKMPGFTAVNFTGASLRGTDFSRAKLKGAIFREADLTGANFTFADLTDADFTGANLTNTVFTITQQHVLRQEVRK
ncbi:pentapeptide repeat-containing protein [Paenibacillus sp. Leaf72]|uniref:pentapeptide repeat-containing protein n=1 Tax=Paenibacillus sp. Leaf72 TaxID=1736234 RepID=UPI0006F4F176|nr:pentapeptide repeat-containing protein [Paenibacillus sp. Leaf72]KQO01095.1 hypothetical protein ASF12_14675 [Paenibacillus sp. Leaf72]